MATKVETCIQKRFNKSLRIRAAVCEELWRAGAVGHPYSSGAVYVSTLIFSCLVRFHSKECQEASSSPHASTLGWVGGDTNEAETKSP